MDTYVIMKKKGQWYEDVSLNDISIIDYTDLEDLQTDMQENPEVIQGILDEGFEIVIKKI